MSLVLAPIPTEILPWMQGFASVYLQSHALMSEELRDHAGSALINFHVHVMAPSRSGHPILGVDRLRIARNIAEADQDRLTEWERELETLDCLWKKSLCTHLSTVVGRLREGAEVFATREEPVWVEDLLDRGMIKVFHPEPKGPEKVIPSQIVFLNTSVRSALAKGDAEKVQEVIERIDALNPPFAAAYLRKTAQEFLSEEGLAKEPTAARKFAVSQAGRKALLALAGRSDASVLSLLEALTGGDARLFGETPYGGRYLEPDSAAVFRTVAEALVAGDFGLEGQHLLETYCRDGAYVLPQPETRGFRKDAGVGEAALRAVFKHRSGLLLLRLLAKNWDLDPLLHRAEFLHLPLYFTTYHLNHLEALAKQGRSVALQWVLRHEGLRDAIERASPAGRERAVQALIPVYLQASQLADREATADAIEVTGHAAAVAFFQMEINRLSHVHSLRDVRDLVGRIFLGESGTQARFQRRIERIHSLKRSESG